MELNVLELELSINQNVDPNVKDDIILDAKLFLQEGNLVKDDHVDIAEGLVDCVFHVNLFVVEDANLAGSNGPSQINFSVNLGPLDFDIDEFPIEVTVSEKKDKKERAKGRVKNTAAKQFGKPIPNNVPDDSILR